MTGNLCFFRLNVKVLYLVRDPRATLNSRSQLNWCRNQSDCENATVYCRMLEHEFHLAQEFVQKYPRTFKFDLNPHKFLKNFKRLLTGILFA